MDPCEIARGYLQISPTGWWFQPLCKITVSWDYKSQHMESHIFVMFQEIFQTTSQFSNHQTMKARELSSTAP